MRTHFQFEIFNLFIEETSANQANGYVALNISSISYLQKRRLKIFFSKPVISYEEQRTLMS